MALATLLFNNFSSGELSPLMLARTDFPRYRTGALTLENWLVLLQGGIRTRFGTRFVSGVKTHSRLTLVRPFEASGDDAYILEVGHEYLRFYRDGARITDGGSPVEVVTPYQESELRALRTAQANDVLFLAHANHPPAQLSRLSDTSWSYKEIVFDPPPLYEAGESPTTTLTPSAVSGSITLTAGAAVFLASDVDRTIQAGDARVAITGFTSTSQVTGDVISVFANTNPIAAGGWTLRRSPAANCEPSEAGPLGAIITLDLQKKQPTEAELISDGAFSSGLGAWTDLSGPVLATGTHDGGNGSASRVTDSTQNFIGLGISPGHIVENVTDGSFAVVAKLIGTTSAQFDSDNLQGGSANTFNNGDTYEIRGTGGIDARDNKLYILGNTAGRGSAQRAITTVAGVAYRVTADVSEGPVSFQVGSASGASDLFAERTFAQENEASFVFTATGTTSYLQVRNNQSQAGAVDNVSCKRESITGWRSTDVGKFVLINQGLVKITAFVSATRVQGQILRELTSDAVAVAGAWSLREPAWSDTLGWPSVVCFFEGRLMFAGAARFPQTEWGSAVNDFTNFFVGPNANDAVEFPIVDSAGNITLNLVRWLMPGENLLAGTTHAEYRQTGPTDGAFSAIDLPLVRLQSTFGSDAVQPVRVGQSLLFAQRQGSKLRQMVFDADVTSSFLAKDLTNLSGHLLETSRIFELTFQPEPIPIIYAVRADGQLLTLTYDILEEVAGWSRLVTDGVVESQAVIPHATANSYEVWVTVRRTINGQTVRYVEVFDDQAVMSFVQAYQGTVPSWKGLTVDSAKVYDLGGVATTTLTDLGHLEGASVAIVGDGAVFPPQTVSSGAITLPSAVQDTAWVGLPFMCTGETLPVELMLQDGTLQDYSKEFLKLFARVYQTIGLTLNGERMPFRMPEMPMNQGVVPFTGKRELLPPSQGWALDTTITFVQDQPLPATLLSVSGVLDIGGV